MSDKKTDILEDVNRKKAVVDLINKGYSRETKIPKSLSGAPKARGFKMPHDPAVRFTKSRPGHATKSARVRLPRTKAPEIITPKIKSIFDSLDIDTSNFIIEEGKKVDKLLKKSKELKAKENTENDVDFEIKKTMTGNSANTNIVEINPTISSSSRLQNFQ